MVCDSFLYDLDYNDNLFLSSLFGIVIILDNCGNVIVEELVLIVIVNDCGLG